MRARRSLLIAIAVALTAPFLLGADQGCSWDGSMEEMKNSLPGRLVMRIFRTVGELDKRVDRIEACTCCCDGILEPACGDDGRTYLNPCEARCAGAEVVGRGECMFDCGGPEGVACEDGSFCERPPRCDDPWGPGQCQEKPRFCPTDEWVPVCGCDGTTYGNDCLRRQAGAAIDHPGECRMPPRQCNGNVDCDDDELCVAPDGQCGAPGICRLKPMGCPRERVPVCGCDGKTYSNKCEALSQGTTVAHPGACRPATCMIDDQCADGSFCEHEQCVDTAIATIPGVCQPRPGMCPEIYAPVCGCDGTTYDNECFRRKAGVSQRHPGRCEEPPEDCKTNDECDAKDYCAKPPEVCDGEGECRPRPDYCDLILAPSILVCGCDGNTHPGFCEAAAKGVNVAHTGSCEPERCGGIAGLTCTNERDACIFAPGTCQIADNMGLCVDPPEFCPQYWDPVCGCDGMTYGNECEATADGVSIDHPGRCLEGLPGDQ